MGPLGRFALNQPQGLTREQVQAIEDDKQIEAIMNDQNYVEWRLGCCIKEMQELVTPAKLTRIIDGILN